MSQPRPRRGGFNNRSGEYRPRDPRARDPRTTKAVGRGDGRRKDLSQFIDGFFGYRNQIQGQPQEGVNYTQETLSYMTSKSRGDQIAQILVERVLQRPNQRMTVVECCAGIGGNTLSFLDHPQIEQVIAFETVPERREILRNNIAMYHFQDKAVIPNTSFTKVDLPNTQYKALFMDPPWLPEGIKGHESTKEQYLLQGITVGGKTLEEWIRLHADYDLIAFKVPPGYRLQRLDGFIVEPVELKNTLLLLVRPLKPLLCQNPVGSNPLDQYLRPVLSLIVPQPALYLTTEACTIWTAALENRYYQGLGQDLYRLALGQYISTRSGLTYEAGLQQWSTYLEPETIQLIEEGFGWPPKFSLIDFIGGLATLGDQINSLGSGYLLVLTLISQLFQNVDFGQAGQAGQQLTTQTLPMQQPSGSPTNTQQPKAVQ